MSIDSIGNKDETFSDDMNFISPPYCLPPTATKFSVSSEFEHEKRITVISE